MNKSDVNLIDKIDKLAQEEKGSTTPDSKEPVLSDSLENHQEHT